MHLLAALSLLAGLLLAFAPQSSSASAPTYTITVSPAAALTDGQAFTVTVKGPPGMSVNNSGFCDPSMPAPTGQDTLTEWCTDSIGNGAAGGTAPADPKGVAELTIRAGVGEATKTSAALGTTHKWQCDSTHACILPLVISPPGASSTFDVSTVLHYRDDDPTAGCGGPAPDQFATAAPDRLTDQWISWTVGDCAGKGLPTSASFTNDGSALSQISAGSTDLAYSAVAPGTKGFGDARRPTVATPVALNATVLAVAGFYPSASSVSGVRLWRHIDSVKMTLEEAAALMSGNLSLRQDLQDSLVLRNPELKVQASAIGFTSAATLAGPQATTQLATALLAKHEADSWNYPPSKSKYGDQAGKPLGAFGDYNTVTNSLAMVDLFAGKPQLVGDIYRKLSEKPEAVSLVSFYLTDLATANQLGLAPVALDDGSGHFVSPTPAALAAAVPHMTKAANGFRTASTEMTAGAYPLTFVEYALTPEQALLDAKCKPTAEAAAINHWLTYLAGPGQSPASFAASGLVPLTPDLLKEAKASLAKVGATKPTTGACAGTTPTTTPPTTPSTIPDSGGAPLGSTGGLPTGNVPLGDLSSGGSTGSTDLGTSSSGVSDATGTVSAGSTSANAETRGRTSASVRKAQQVAAITRIPRLGRPLGSPLILTLFAFPALVLCTSAAGWLSRGQPLRAPWARRRAVKP